MRAMERAALLAGVAGSVLLGTIPAAAQDAPAGTAEQDNGDILVLASKLEESTPREIEKYGSRLDVIDGERIDEAGFVDAGGALQFLAPGLFLRRQRRLAAVRRIDDERGVAEGADPVLVAEERLLVHGAEAVGFVTARALQELLLGEVLAVGVLRRTAHRHAAHVVARELPADVGMTPGRSGCPRCRRRR